jgi:hypothetical protein
MKSLTGQIMRGVTSVEKQIFNDRQLQVSVIWRVFTKAEFDPVRRMNVERYIEYPLTMVRFQKKEDSMLMKNLPVGVGGLITGSFEYALKFTDAPSGISIRDLIVEDGKIYAITKLHNVMNRFVLVAIQGLK